MSLSRRSMLVAATGTLGLLSGCSGSGDDGNSDGDTDREEDEERSDTEEPAEATDTPVVPAVSWAFDHDPDAKTVTITHNSGDPIDAALLTVELGDSPTETQFADVTDEVAAGDAIEVDVSGASGERLEIVWSPDGADRSEVIGQYTVP